MTIAFVQTAGNSSATNAVTVTLGANTTAGNCLVVCIGMGSGGAHATVSSVTLGGSSAGWSQLAAVGDLTTGAEQLAVWVDPNCAGGQTSVVVTLSGASVTLAQVFEFSGVAASSVLDQSVTFDSGAGTNSTFSVTSGTTTQPSEVAVGCVYGFNTTITGPSSPWVNETTVTSTTRTLQAGYDILSSTGTVTYSGSFGAAAFNGQILVTLFGASAATPQQLPQRKRYRKRQTLQRPSPSAVAVPGSVQPWPTVPVPRRRLVRAVVAGSKPFLGYVAVPAPLQGPYLPPRRRPARAVVEFTPVTTTNKPVGVVQPWATVPIRRRVLQRAVVAHVYGSAFVKVPAPLQGPYLPPRRRPARAVVAGSRPFLGYVAVPAPLQGPYLPPRRVPARAVWRGSAPFLGFVAVPAPRQSPYLPPRRVPGRAVVEFTPVTTANAAPAVPVPPRQQPGPAPRRIPARAVVEFTPVTTTNSTAAAPSGSVQPWATVPIRRRQLQRAVIAHAYGAGFVAVPAPRQSPYLPPRRTQVRATVAHAYGSAFVAVPAPRQQPGPAPRRKPGRAVVQFRPVRTTNGTAAVTAVLRQGDYDHKSWIKKRWILRV